MNEFQERLNELILENNLNRLNLAKTIGISSTTINGYFNNNYYPTLDIAIKLCKYFHCSLDYLFGLSDFKLNANSNNKSFIENIDHLLQINNLSISKFLNDLQMSEYNYYRWKNLQTPKTGNLVVIANYFGVGLDFLVGNVNK
ncbi:MAG: helix-turn-helix transcriptional regulator [Clostridia bacterium]|nr:helix-turn-helix transcriptional regulator [Clostridia bacterium]